MADQLEITVDAAGSVTFTVDTGKLKELLMEICGVVTPPPGGATGWNEGMWNAGVWNGAG